MEQPSPISRYRTDHGLTLKDLAKRLNVDKSTVLRWERGTVAVPTDRLSEVERITGISRHELRPDVFGQPEQAA